MLASLGDCDADLALPIWAGVIPVRTVIGAAEPSPHLPAGVARPATLSPYAEGRTLDEALLETQLAYAGEDAAAGH